MHLHVSFRSNKSGEYIFFLIKQRQFLKYFKPYIVCMHVCLLAVIFFTGFVGTLLRMLVSHRNH